MNFCIFFLGDVALCVNPNDTRYTHLIGKHAFNPFTKQRMPILADQAVKPEFGTGVLKVTPAHSPIDYEIGLRHNLPLVSIFDERGFMNSSYEPLNNVHRFEAKQLIINELEKRGLYCGFKEHAQGVPVCSRSGDIIEYRLIPQWFVRCDNARYIGEFIVNKDNLSESSSEKWHHLSKTLDESEHNISLIPSSYRNTWKDWFSRYKDWCISRQIYWGHQIPAYQVHVDSMPTNQWVAAKRLLMFLLLF